MLTTGGKVFLKKPQFSQLVKKFPERYEAQTCIVVFTTARHLLRSWARLIPVNATPSYLI
jgi:hypothetical protein